MNEVPRDNRSFIGLMERCNIGAWCKYEDIDDIIATAVETRNEAIKDTTKALEDVIKLHKKLKDAYTLVILSGTINILFAVSAILQRIYN